MVEAFFDRNLIPTNRALFDKEKQKAEEYYGYSVVRFLGNELITVATTHLQGELKRTRSFWNVSQTTRLFDPINSPEFSTYRSMVKKDYTGIVVGSALISLEDSLVTNNFSQDAFVGRISDAIKDTPLIPPEIPRGKEPSYYNNPEKFKRMRKAAEKDKTLASLLRNPGFRPGGLNDFITTYYQDLYPQIWDIINRYEDLAYFLIYKEKLPRKK